ncbi:queuosine precursor transporter [Gorillibacterium massiliense]|uniref:queuosine precursor transporter n=1 Tax=Gorillibacterium massiliense TaxID=1280390 RepID=UPI0004B6DDE3|nr:queuosine precursor transporter [Gorillibacterium massiliense]
MFNFWWGLFFVIVNFVLFLACYRLFGIRGLYTWIGLATVLANIQVVKTIEVMGIVMTLGNTIYASIYMTTDSMNERYGTKEARKAVWYGFFCLLTATVLMQMVLHFRPEPSDIAQGPFETIFGLMPRIAAGSICAFLVSQLLDVFLFSKIKRKFAARNQFWIRINGSTIVSQFIDTLIFCSIAFLGVHTFDVWIQIFLTTYVMKFIISVASTPVLYIARTFPKETDAELAPGRS